ncbi:MAG: polysaccharide biosynthesis C-terminal domain-containing protein [Leeuwenhoekiella sp.]
MKITKLVSKNQNAVRSIKALLLRIMGVGLLFLTTLYLTNFYAASIVGEYEFARSILLFLGSLVLIGTDQSILYYGGFLKAKNATSELFPAYKKMVLTVFFLSAALCIVFMVLPKSLYHTIFRDNTSYILMQKVGAVLFFYALTLLNTEYFRAIDRLYLSELFRSFIKYSPLAIGVFFLNYFNKQSYLIDVFLYGFIALAIITSIIVISKKGKKKKTTHDDLGFIKIIKRSYPMAISSLGFFLLLSIDVLFLKRYSNFANIAYYAVAIKIIFVLSLILNGINASIAPKIAELYSKNEHIELKALLRSNARLIFFLSLPLILLIIFFPASLLGLFGNQYIVAKGALYLLLGGHLASTIFGSAAVYLNMTGKQRLFQNILLITVLINLVLNWVLIPKYGIEGAAVASSFSVIFWNVVAAIKIYKADGIKLFVR